MSKYLSEFGDIVKGHAVYQLADGMRVPGATTITGQVGKGELIDWAAMVTREGLDHRAIAEESARVGTLAHALVRCHLLGVEPGLSHYSANQAALAQNAMRKFLEYAKWHKLESLMLEAPLVSEAHRYGGTIDYYGLCDGEPAIIDWKTGGEIYEGHRLQAASRAWRHVLKHSCICWRTTTG